MPLDTFYVEHNEKIKAVIKEKFKRIIPKKIDNKYGLTDAKNPLGLQKLPSLNKEAVLAVSKVSTLIASYYKKPMDIELVYLPSSKTIYIVQTRPLVFKPRQQSPSYLSDIDQFTHLQKIKVIKIVPGDAAVQLITAQDQVLTAATDPQGCLI